MKRLRPYRVCIAGALALTVAAVLAATEFDSLATEREDLGVVDPSRGAAAVVPAPPTVQSVASLFGAHR